MSFASLWLRPRTSPTIQWVTIPPCPSACHLNSCFGPRGFEPPHPAHPNSVLSLCLGDSHASGLASIPKGSESRKILWESLCPAQERQRLVSLLVSCHVVQTPPPASVPSAHPWGGVVVWHLSSGWHLPLLLLLSVAVFRLLQKGEWNREVWISST